MSQKDEARRMKLAVKFDYTSITNAAGFQTAHTTTAVDTQGFETNMYILILHTAAVTDNYVFTLYESDTSATDAPGTTCTAVGTGDSIVLVDDHNATQKAKISSAGVLTTTCLLVTIIPSLETMNPLPAPTSWFWVPFWRT